jgi:hypothetical protein
VFDRGLVGVFAIGAIAVGFAATAVGLPSWQAAPWIILVLYAAVGLAARLVFRGSGEFDGDSLLIIGLPTWLAGVASAATSLILVSERIDVVLVAVIGGIGSTAIAMFSIFAWGDELQFALERMVGAAAALVFYFGLPLVLSIAATFATRQVASALPDSVRVGLIAVIATILAIRSLNYRVRRSREA